MKATASVSWTKTAGSRDEIKRVRRQAEKASIAKSEFLANMSHEIRTPMNAIIGLNDIIMEECGDAEIYAHAKDVQSAAKSLLAIINDILDLSKVEAGKMELVYVDYHIKAMVDEIIGMMDMAASQRGLILKYECDEKIPCRYCGDDGRIKQILINILSNAIKFTKEGYVRAYITGQPGRNVPGGGYGMRDQAGRPWQDLRGFPAGGFQAEPECGGNRAGACHCKTFSGADGWNH